MTSLVFILFALQTSAIITTYNLGCKITSVSSSEQYQIDNGQLVLTFYSDDSCTQITRKEEVMTIQANCEITQSQISCLTESTKERKEFNYCDSGRRKHVTYGLAIGYPFAVLCLAAVNLGLGRRIPIINIFLSPFVFASLVVMCDRIICKKNDFEVIVSSGIFVSALLLELIIIFITRIFYRDTDFYNRVFAAHSILMELWNGNFNHNLPDILNRYISGKPEGNVYGESYHYISKILNKKSNGEYQQIDEEDTDYSKLLTKTTFKTTQRISYKSWEKNTTKLPKLPTNSMLRVTIEEGIRLSPGTVQAQNEVYDKITSICKNKDTNYSVTINWETPFIYKNFYVVQSRFLDFLLSWKIFGLLYVFSMAVGLNLLVDCIWRFLETPFKFRMEKTVSVDNDLPMKW
ncbi:hypothetical protein EHI8A_125170 [Entamoeba histolytica HM-1:IMSS-B]|nr:hypothetical protein EHI8A_125170 [Entamoeba histolytica HM-1:IMSS-B]GAT96131.1 hypothetical protein CL6EHI_030410 [Entamoeba histolytica]